MSDVYSVKSSRLGNGAKRIGGPGRIESVQFIGGPRKVSPKKALEIAKKEK